MVEMRKEVDSLLAAVWDSVEKFFSGLPETERRSRAEEYGIVYVLRKGEQKPG